MFGRNYAISGSVVACFHSDIFLAIGEKMHYMKNSRILFVLLSALFTVTPLFSGTYASASNDFSVEWMDGYPTLIAVATWMHEGERYEMAVAGLKDKVSEEKLGEVARAFHEGEDTILTDPALTDAEKFSHLIPHRAGADGTWAVMDDVREDLMWGDSLLCWASSASNMLFSSGWAGLAKDPETGEAYPDEDAVFSYLTRSFYNDGSFQEEGIGWFFSGTVHDESVLRDTSEAKKLLPDDPNAYMSSVFAENLKTTGCETVARMAESVKKGAALGVSISSCSVNYTLVADPAVEVTVEDGLYIEHTFVELTDEEYLLLPEHYWTYDENGGVVLLMEEDGAFKDSAGNICPIMSVKKDHLYYDADLERYAVPEPEKNGFIYTVEKKIVHSADEINVLHSAEYPVIGNGNHAVTVAGYIKNLSCADDGMDGIRALLIADSDNDANIWRVDTDTLKKEERPNTYTVCYVKEAMVDDVSTLALTNYLEDGNAYVAYACLLWPKGVVQDSVPAAQAGDYDPFVF